METYQIINSVGLGFDIVGVILLWIYGFPTKTTKTINNSHPYGVITDIKEMPLNKWKFFGLSALGLMFILLGFGIQLVSNFF